MYHPKSQFKKFDEKESVPKVIRNSMQKNGRSFEESFLREYHKEKEKRLDQISNPQSNNSEESEVFIEKSLANEPIRNSLVALKNSVIESVSKWVEGLRSPVQIIIDSYYELLKKNKLDHKEEILDELTKEEVELLKIVDNFDIESLNLYKDISQEERELMELCNNR